MDPAHSLSGHPGETEVSPPPTPPSATPSPSILPFDWPVFSAVGDIACHPFGSPVSQRTTCVCCSVVFGGGGCGLGVRGWHTCAQTYTLYIPGPPHTLTHTHTHTSSTHTVQPVMSCPSGLLRPTFRNNLGNEPILASQNESSSATAFSIGYNRSSP